MIGAGGMTPVTSSIYAEFAIVPLKFPVSGGTSVALQVPVVDCLLHPPPAPEYEPSIELLSGDTFPVRIRVDPPSLIEKVTFCPLNVPVTGAAPEQPPGSTKLPVTELADCKRNPDTGSTTLGRGNCWTRLNCQLPEREPLCGREEPPPLPQDDVRSNRHASNVTSRILTHISGKIEITTSTPWSRISLGQSDPKLRSVR